MARSGSETRRRSVKKGARFTPEEAALIEEQASRCDVSVAALIRHALLDQPPLRASRQPSLEKTQLCQMLGQLGQIATEVRTARVTSENPRLWEAIHRDIADMRGALLEALGRRP